MSFNYRAKVISRFLRESHAISVDEFSFRVVAADLCWFYASDLGAILPYQFEWKYKRRGVEEERRREERRGEGRSGRERRGEYSTGRECRARKYAVFGRGTLAVVSHILGRPPVRPTTVASANLSTSPECFTRRSWHFFLSPCPSRRRRSLCNLNKDKDVHDFSLSRASSLEISSTRLEVIMAEPAVSTIVTSLIKAYEKKKRERELCYYFSSTNVQRNFRNIFIVGCITQLIIACLITYQIRIINKKNY